MTWTAAGCTAIGSRRAPPQLGSPHRMRAAPRRSGALSCVQGVLHRDIKPENVMLGDDGGLRLGDFGLAINTSREQPMSRVGTLDYMAPEVREGRRLLDCVGPTRDVHRPRTAPRMPFLDADSEDHVFGTEAGAGGRHQHPRGADAAARRAGVWVAGRYVVRRGAGLRAAGGRPPI